MTAMKWVWIVLAGICLGALAASVPRFIDRTPPVLSHESWVDADCVAVHSEQGQVIHQGDAPDHPVFGRIQAFYVARDTGTGVRMVVRVDGEEIVTDQMEEDAAFSVELDADELGAGEHLVEVEIRDRSFWGNAITLRRTLVVDDTDPVLTLGASSTTAAQGMTAAIFVRASEPLARVRGGLDDEQIRFHTIDDGTTWRALTGISVKRPPGDVPLTIYGVDRAGRMDKLDALLTVTKTDFPMGGYIKLSPKKKTDMMNRDKSEEANRKRSAAYAAKVDLPVPDEFFRLPVKGRISSPFGKVRRYNTGVERHHLGTDMAASRGTPVQVAAGGRVVLAELLHIYGNAVIVNHADGVSTSYNHLSRIDVEVGQEVRAGDIIGAVGSTGQSTGPHLHWGMVVDGTAVAPEQWTERTFDAPPEGDFE